MHAENLTPGTLMNRRDAAEYVRTTWGRPCSLGYLNRLAVTGDGPAFRKIGGRWVVYDRAELDRWATAAISTPVTSTADAREKGILRGRKAEGRISPNPRAGAAR